MNDNQLDDAVLRRWLHSFDHSDRAAWPLLVEEMRKTVGGLRPERDSFIPPPPPPEPEKPEPPDRPEYVHCIERPWTKPLDRSTFCGRPLEVFDWSFMSLFHAIEAARQGSRLVPCEECVRKADANEKPGQ